MTKARATGCLLNRGGLSIVRLAVLSQLRALSLAQMLTDGQTDMRKEDDSVTPVILDCKKQNWRLFWSNLIRADGLRSRPVSVLASGFQVKSALSHPQAQMRVSRGNAMSSAYGANSNLYEYIHWGPSNPSSDGHSDFAKTPQTTNRGTEQWAASPTASRIRFPDPQPWSLPGASLAMAHERRQFTGWQLGAIDQDRPCTKTRTIMAISIGYSHGPGLSALPASVGRSQRTMASEWSWRSAVAIVDLAQRHLSNSPFPTWQPPCNGVIGMHDGVHFALAPFVPLTP